LAPFAHSPIEKLGAATRPLPSRIAGLISPSVLAKRATKIAARLEDLTGERARKRRCVEIIVKHLLDEHTHAA
jgi:hypothetical protein